MKTTSSSRGLLVLGSESNMVQSVADLLGDDYRVLSATEPAKAQYILAQEDIQLVLADQRLSGVEFLRSVKASHPEAVGLLFAAPTDVAAAADAVTNGDAYRYIVKPWEPVELKAILRQAGEYYDLQAERKRLLRELEEKNRQLESAHDDLHRANQIKSAFIRVASHELRTPLTVILGLTELAQGMQLGDPALRSYLAQIRSSGQRLNDRIDQLVQLLPAERLQRPLRRRPVDVASLLRRAVQSVTNFLEQRKQSLKMYIADNLGIAQLDEEKIHDSLLQLLMNAIKFTPDEGTIELSARKVQGADNGAPAENSLVSESSSRTVCPTMSTGLPRIVIQVVDHGIGISAENLPYIFDPFFTSFDAYHHSSGTCEFNRRGLGVGLSVVKAFVEMHGGQVHVASELAHGTTFTVELPFVGEGL